LKFLASSIRHEEEIKWIQIGKEEEKLSLFADDVILFLRDPNNCTNKNPVEIINSFGKVSGYKITIQHLFHIPKMHRPRKKSEKKNLIYHSFKYNTVPRNKFHKRNQRPI
jgi:DNA polymerase III delta subunit